MWDSLEFESSGDVIATEEDELTNTTIWYIANDLTRDYEQSMRVPEGFKEQLAGPIYSEGAFETVQWWKGPHPTESDENCLIELRRVNDGLELSRMAFEPRLEAAESMVEISCGD